MDNKGQVENILRELGQKIDELIVEAKGATGEVREELEQKIKEFKEKKWSLEEDFENFKKDNEGKWDEIKSHLSSAASELELAVKAALKRKN